ncbi:MAG: YceD family protein [Pyrinomonadaceae bacterium]
MLVELGSLERQGGRFAHNYQPDELTLDDERVNLAAPPKIAGQIRRSGARLTVEGEIEAEIRLECDRCLKPMQMPISSVFKIDYVTPAVYHAEPAAELLEEDLALSVFDGEVIDVDEIVREQLLLTLPTQALCSDDCKGLCSSCGADRNLTQCNCGEVDIDPRWAGLKGILDR